MVPVLFLFLSVTPPPRQSVSPPLPLSCLSPSSSPCFPVIFEMRTHTVGCGDAPVSPIENLFAALMLASQNCDCLSTFFMVRCQMDVSCLMKIICAQFPFPLCSWYQLCVSVCVFACVPLWVSMWVCVCLFLPSASVFMHRSPCEKYSHIHSHLCICAVWRVNRWKWMPSDTHVFMAVCVCVCARACMCLCFHFISPLSWLNCLKAQAPLSFLNVQGESSTSL